MADVTWVPVTDEVAAVRLSSADLVVDVLPANGADVQSIVDRRTGVDFLWTSPWGTDLRPDDAPTSRDRWLTRAWGGWQLLLPNTGDEATEGGRTWGFHGEAGMRAWEVAVAEPGRAGVTLDLETAPLSLRRAYRVDGADALGGDDCPQPGSPSPSSSCGASTRRTARPSPPARRWRSTRVRSRSSSRTASGSRRGAAPVWPARSSGRLARPIPRGSPSRFLFGFLDGPDGGDLPGPQRPARPGRPGLVAPRRLPVRLALGGDRVHRGPAMERAGLRRRHRAAGRLSGARDAELRRQGGQRPDDRSGRRSWPRPSPSAWSTPDGPA